MPIIFRKDAADQRSQTLVVGEGLSLTQTADGLPELTAETSSAGETVLQPSGSDDTTAIQDAIWANAAVRLAPGTFNVSAIVDFAAGTLVTGAGRDRTTIVKSNFDGPAFRFGDQVEHAGLEDLTISGPGKAITGGNKAILASRNAPPAGLAIARRMSFRNLYVKDFGEDGMNFSNCSQIEIANVIFENIGYNPIYFGGGGSSVITCVRAVSSGPIYVRVASGVTLIGCEAESCFGSFLFDTVTDCAAIACVSRKCEEVPLHVAGGSNIVVDSFASDNVGTPYFVDEPHLLVDGGAVGVQINGFRRVNTDQTGTLTSEADVSAAGGPVLAGFHDFTAGAIVSSGHFCDVASTPRP